MHSAHSKTLPIWLEVLPLIGIGISTIYTVTYSVAIDRVGLQTHSIVLLLVVAILVAIGLGKAATQGHQVLALTMAFLAGLPTVGAATLNLLARGDNQPVLTPKDVTIGGGDYRITFHRNPTARIAKTAEITQLLQDYKPPRRNYDHDVFNCKSYAVDLAEYAEQHGVRASITVVRLAANNRTTRHAIVCFPRQNDKPLFVDTTPTSYSQDKRPVLAVQVEKGQPYKVEHGTIVSYINDTIQRDSYPATNQNPLFTVTEIEYF